MVSDHAELSRQECLAASPRIFANPVLDRLSRVHHLIPPILYAPIVLGLLYAGGRALAFAAEFGGFLLGYAIWTLVEYLGHRFLFHFRGQSPAARRIHFLIHGVHHDHPSDPLRLVMPPLMSLPIMASAFGLFALLFGRALCMPVLAGFLTGYLIYDMLHFHLHHGQPRTRLGRFLRLRHLHHHFRDETSWFGVSAPWWDEVFGTRPKAVAGTRNDAT